MSDGSQSDSDASDRDSRKKFKYRVIASSRIAPTVTIEGQVLTVGPVDADTNGENGPSPLEDAPLPRSLAEMAFGDTVSGERWMQVVLPAYKSGGMRGWQRAANCDLNSEHGRPGKFQWDIKRTRLLAPKRVKDGQDADFNPSSARAQCLTAKAAMNELWRHLYELKEDGSLDDAPLRLRNALEDDWAKAPAIVFQQDIPRYILPGGARRAGAGARSGSGAGAGSSAQNLWPMLKKFRERGVQPQVSQIANLLFSNDALRVLQSGDLRTPQRIEELVAPRWLEFPIISSQRVLLKDARGNNVGEEFRIRFSAGGHVEERSAQNREVSRIQLQLDKANQEMEQMRANSRSRPVQQQQQRGSSNVARELSEARNTIRQLQEEVRELKEGSDDNANERNDNDEDEEEEEEEEGDDLFLNRRDRDRQNEEGRGRQEQEDERRRQEEEDRRQEEEDRRQEEDEEDERRRQEGEDAQAAQDAEDERGRQEEAARRQPAVNSADQLEALVGQAANSPLGGGWKIKLASAVDTYNRVDNDKKIEVVTDRATTPAFPIDIDQYDRVCPSPANMSTGMRVSYSIMADIWEDVRGYLARANMTLMRYYSSSTNETLGYIVVTPFEQDMRDIVFMPRRADIEAANAKDVAGMLKYFNVAYTGKPKDASNRKKLIKAILARCGADSTATTLPELYTQLDKLQYGNTMRTVYPQQEFPTAKSMFRFVSMPNGADAAAFNPLLNVDPDDVPIMDTLVSCGRGEGVSLFKALVVLAHVMGMKAITMEVGDREIGGDLEEKYGFKPISAETLVAYPGESLTWNVDRDKWEKWTSWTEIAMVEDLRQRLAR